MLSADIYRMSASLQSSMRIPAIASLVAAPQAAPMHSAPPSPLVEAKRSLLFAAHSDALVSMTAGIIDGLSAHLLTACTCDTLSDDSSYDSYTTNLPACMRAVI
jgi:hypothetical protein